MANLTAVARTLGRLAERDMNDTCEVLRQTGTVFNSETGLEEATFEVVYEGKCRIVSAATEERFVVIGEARVTQSRYNVYLPRSAADFREGDLVDVSSTRDGLLDGSRLYVRDPFLATHAPTRKVSTEWRHEDQEGS